MKKTVSLDLILLMVIPPEKMWNREGTTRREGYLPCERHRTAGLPTGSGAECTLRFYLCVYLKRPPAEMPAV